MEGAGELEVEGLVLHLDVALGPGQPAAQLCWHMAPVCTGTATVPRSEGMRGQP